MNHKKKIIRTAAILIIFSGCLGFYRWYSMKQKANVLVDSSVTKAQIKSGDSLYPLIGTYKGTAYIANEALVFPSSTLTIRENSDFEITATGSNLALLNNTSLQVDGAYPSMSINLKGTIESQPMRAAKLIVADVATNLVSLVGGVESPLDPESTKKIMSIIESVGIKTPESGKSSPITINTSIIPTTNGIILQSAKDQPIYVNFNGIK